MGRRGERLHYEDTAEPFTQRLVILEGEVINEMAEGESRPSLPGGLIETVNSKTFGGCKSSRQDP